MQKQKLIAFNVGHWQTIQADAIKRAADGARLVRVMNWLRAYTFDGPRLLTEADAWKFKGGPWHSWRGHVPLSVCLDNTVGAAELYINLPYALDEQSLTSAALYLCSARTNRLIITVGCEPWNTAPPYAAQRAFFAEQGNGDPLTGYCARLRILQDAVELAGARRGVTVAAECHTMNSAVAWTVTHRAPGAAIAIAPYIGRKRLAGNETPAELSLLILDDLFGPVSEQMVKHDQIAKRAGVPLLAYEAGHHLVGESESMKKMVESGALADAYGSLTSVWRVLSDRPLPWYRWGKDGRGEWWDVRPIFGGS